MAEIARRAGISHTGLLHHFPSKDELLTAVLALQDDRSGEYLADHAALGPNGDRLSVLRGLVAILRSTSTRSSPRTCTRSCGRRHALMHDADREHRRAVPEYAGLAMI
jgi:AcrR family transcriptional regulator